MRRHKRSRQLEAPTGSLHAFLYSKIQKLEQVLRTCRSEFPHSEIFGSKVARHLPEAFRRQAASFIALWSQGIHHMRFHSCGEWKNRSPALYAGALIHAELAQILADSFSTYPHISASDQR